MRTIFYIGFGLLGTLACVYGIAGMVISQPTQAQIPAYAAVFTGGIIGAGVSFAVFIVGLGRMIQD